MSILEPKSVNKLATLLESGDTQRAEVFIEKLVNVGQSQWPPEVFENVALFYEKQGNLEKSIDFLSAGIRNFGKRVDPLIRRAAIYLKLAKYKSCFADLDRSYALDPENPDLNLLLVLFFLETSNLGPALKALQRVPASYSGYYPVALRYALQTNDYPLLELSWGHILRKSQIPEVSRILAPLHFLILTEDQGLINLCLESNNYYVAQSKSERSDYHSGRSPVPRVVSNDRLRVCYVSGDFNHHAVGNLIGPVFREHSDAIYGIGLMTQAVDASNPCTKLISEFLDEFHEYSPASSHPLNSKIRSADLVVDLSGHTKGGYPQFWRQFGVPIVSYLGYPGSVGNHCADFTLTDQYICQGLQLKYYSETVEALDCCYQPYDSFRPIYQRVKLRSKSHLIGCLNQCNKVSRADIVTWSAILRECREYKFALLVDHDLNRVNLAKEFFVNGIDESRLVFFNRCSRDEYLDRLWGLDLFLDSSPYNAHTTCNDSLYVGTPVLTMRGDSFHSRVAGSILWHSELADLIFDSREDFVRFSVETLNSASGIVDLNHRVAIARKKAIYFDLERFVSTFERKLLCLASSST